MLTISCCLLEGYNNMKVSPTGQLALPCRSVSSHLQGCEYRVCATACCKWHRKVPVFQIFIMITSSEEQAESRKHTS